MGCDGYLSNSNKPAVLITCHICNRPVDGIVNHEACKGDDGRLPVDVDISDYEAR
jgi:hypothetical protein